MNIVFTGHRDKITHHILLEQIAKAYPGATWWHGGAEGFDTQIDKFCRANGITVHYILPDSTTELPRLAPLRRNDKLLKLLKDGDILYACYDGRKRGGTYYTLNNARKIERNVKIFLLPALDIKEKDKENYANPRTRYHN